ncbi:MAG: hypothetical protein ABIA02_02820 [Candidatus Falkowbacteria bacterium]
MYSRIAVNSILILSLVIFQLAVINGMPAGINNLNLILVVLIFILSLMNLDLAMWWSIGAGFFLDIFLLAPFGFYLISLSLTVVIANFLLIHFFTNRSLYTFFSLVFLSSIIYEVFLNFFWFLIRLISGKEIIVVINSGFWASKLTQLIFNLIATLIIFNLINFISKKLKPVFLVKN